MDFVDWLMKSKKLGLRSARDVQSRLNRVLNSSEKAYLLKEEGLKRLVSSISESSSVKSQLKRAVLLFKEFKKDNG